MCVFVVQAKQAAGGVTRAVLFALLVDDRPVKIPRSPRCVFESIRGQSRPVFQDAVTATALGRWRRCVQFVLDGPLEWVCRVFRLECKCAMTVKSNRLNVKLRHTQWTALDYTMFSD